MEHDIIKNEISHCRKKPELGDAGPPVFHFLIFFLHIHKVSNGHFSKEFPAAKQCKHIAQNIYNGCHEHTPPVYFHMQRIIHGEYPVKYRHENLL